jgi:hypothetical protein
MSNERNLKIKNARGECDPTLPPTTEIKPLTRTVYNQLCNNTELRYLNFTGNERTSGVVN